MNRNTDSRYDISPKDAAEELAIALHAALVEDDPEASIDPLTPGDRIIIDGQFDLRRVAERALDRVFLDPARGALAVSENERDLLPLLRTMEAAPTYETLPPTDGRFVGDLVKVGRESDYALYLFDGRDWLLQVEHLGPLF